ncbi:hypothetical protein [Planctomicrobium sp. SH527]|uniref:hypothetical protein n=1 Tax=Planctomicrobium sp. SH527 TaxID=3448123 RepID=UPI003F5C9C5E
MTSQQIASWISGLSFMVVYTTIACFIAFRANPQPIDPVATRIFNIILALTGAAFAAIISGFIEVDGKLWAISIRAGSGLAVFIVALIYPLPMPITQQNPKFGKVKRRQVPPGRIPNPEDGERP